MTSEDLNVQVRETEDGITARARHGRYEIKASATWMGEDLLVAIRGGRAHIGAVALAQPRPSLKEAGSVSATASVLCVVGHKEDAVVKTASERLSAALNVRVVAAAGMHWDDLDAEAIRGILNRVDAMVDTLARHLKADGKDNGPG